MFKAFAAASIIGCTSALSAQVKDIYGNPFNHPNEEVKTPTCTLKVHSVLPDLDVPKVPIQTLKKKTGYDPYGIHDDDDFGLDDISGIGSDIGSYIGSGSKDDESISGSYLYNNDDKMDSSEMMSEMMGGMQEGNNMMSSAMQETKPKTQDFGWEPEESIADLISDGLKTDELIPDNPYASIFE